MIADNHFKKAYIINVDIDLDKCHWDSECGVENFETDGGLGELLDDIREDLTDAIIKYRGE